jgi:hypothetical protein
MWTSLVRCSLRTTSGTTLAEIGVALDVADDLPTTTRRPERRSEPAEHAPVERVELLADHRR